MMSMTFKVSTMVPFEENDFHDVVFFQLPLEVSRWVPFEGLGFRVHDAVFFNFPLKFLQGFLVRVLKGRYDTRSLSNTR